jgi:hypothetical protein
MGYAIVVDVSVARAASESPNLVAMKCREILDCISEYDHQLALSKPVQDEWFKSRVGHGELYNQYASYYTLQWFVKMVSERRIVWIEIDDQVSLMNKIVECALLQDQAQIKKDVHLVATALKSDKRVLSCDDKIRKHFQKIGATVKELCEILWLNPINMPAAKWISSGAPNDIQYLLCSK